jgi:hypothetical protein
MINIYIYIYTYLSRNTSKREITLGNSGVYGDIILKLILKQ